MEFDKNFIKECVERLQRARMNLLTSNGFYGMLLSSMTFTLDPECQTAATDGYKIYFGPKFMSELSDSELEFVLMHEVMHIVLQHCLRGQDKDNEIYNIAADIVINSNILMSKDFKRKAITLKRYGEAMHIAPDGKEGHLYTADEVYDMLIAKAKKKVSKAGGAKRGTENDAESGTGSGAGDDPDGGKRADEDVPCILDAAKEYAGGVRFDDHSRWSEIPEDVKKDLYNQWLQKLKDTEQVMSVLEASKTFGGMPMGAKRLLNELSEGQNDWRTLLTNFLQKEICDYSFSPPDRRFSDGDFFLPDYNEEEEVPADVWFLIDTSGSISDKAIKAAYSEIASAIEQFNGKLRGYLSFTECFVTDPVPFSDINDLLKIRPVGGGGNDFGEIFRYMKRNMMDNLPAYIVIITDGYDTFPDEKETLGVPVLWLINNNDSNPPWGKVGRIKIT